MSGIGALIAVWLELTLTTPAAPFPFGRPFAIAGEHFEGADWRIMYGLGGLLAVIGILLRFELPESPRWLVAEGRFAEADRVVTKMEESATTRVGQLPPVPTDLSIPTTPERVGYGEILRNPLYLKRPLSKGRTAIDVRNVFNVAVDVWCLAPRDVKDVLRERFNDVSICVKRERERR